MSDYGFAAFEVDDRVRVENPSSFFYGEEGVVLHVYKTEGNQVSVLFDKETLGLLFLQDELVLVS